jgi:plastocyanin
VSRVFRLGLISVAAALVLGACGGGGGGGKSVDAANGAVTITAEDIKYDYTTVNAEPGKLEITLNEGGSLDHTLTIGDDINLKVSSGERTAKGSIDVKAGDKLTYVCTVPGHSNMRGTIEVK